MQSLLEASQWLRRAFTCILVFLFIPVFAFTEDKTSEIDGEFWLNTWEPLAPDIGTGADSRRTASQFVITQRTKPVGAVLNLEGRTNFTGANNITHSDSSAHLDIPVIFDRLNINFRLGRTFRKHLYFSGIDVYDDGEKFF